MKRMRLRIGSIAALLFVFTAAILTNLPVPKVHAAGSGSSAAQYRDGVVLVGFQDGVSAAQQQAIIASVGARETKVIGVGVHVLSVPNGAVESTIAALKAHAEVRYAEPDFIQHLAAASQPVIPNDPSFNQQWGLRNTGQTVNGIAGTAGADEKAALAWNVTTGSPNVVVAVLDTGVQYDHPDLAANIWNNPGGIGGCAAGTHGFNVLAQSGTAAACNPMDDDQGFNGHGTHVAGIIGAVGNNGLGVSGVAQTVKLLPIKWVAADDSANTSDLITAIDLVIAAKNAGVNVRIVNDSATYVGTPPSQGLLDSLNQLGQSGILFVTAAGNTDENNDVTPRFPCNYASPSQFWGPNNGLTGNPATNLICVAGTNQNDALWNNGAGDASNYGATTVHLAAPGGNIYSTLLNNSYGILTGDSMSSPQVAGAAALLLAMNPNMDLNTLKSTILGSVDQLPSLSGKVATGGRLDICKALAAFGCNTDFGSGGGGGSPLTVTTSGSLASGTQNQAYAGAQLQATGGTSPYHWTVASGALPGGLNLSDSGSITGTPTANGNFTFTAKVTDSSAPANTATSGSLTINISAPNAPSISTTTLAAGTVGTPYSSPALAASGGTAPYTWSMTGAPAWMQLGSTTGALSGTPDAATAGTNITFKVTDNAGLSNTKVLNLVVNAPVLPPITISTQSLPGGTAGTQYTATTLAASGGSGTFNWSVAAGGKMPAGLSLNATTGQITGTPTQGGTSTLLFQATDTTNSQAFGTKLLTITITPSASSGTTNVKLMQTASQAGSGATSVAAAFPGANTAGNTILALVRMSTTTQTVTITDSAGNTYTEIAKQNQDSDGSQIHLFSASSIKAGANTVTATFSAANAHPSIQVFEYSGLTAKDQTAAAQGGTATPTVGPVTTTNANEFVFVGVGLPSSFSGTVTAGSGYTLNQVDPGTLFAASESESLSTAGQVSGSLTLSASANWSMVMATFAAQSTSGGGNTPLAIMSMALPSATQGSTYLGPSLTATGGKSPYSWTAAGVPAGMSVNASTGSVSGIPGATGTTNFTVQVTDAGGQLAQSVFSLTVNTSSGGCGDCGGGGGGGGGGFTGGFIGTIPQVFVSTANVTMNAPAGSTGTGSFSVQTYGGLLPWTATATTKDGGKWLTLLPASGTGTMQIFAKVDATNLTPGTYTATISINATGANNNPAKTTLTVNVAPQPWVLTPAALFFSGPSGSKPAAQQLSIGSNGAPINWTAQVATKSGGNWLSISSPSGTTPATPTVSVNTTGLADGAYQGTITLTSADDPTVTTTINVSLGLGTSTMVLKPSAVMFSTTAGKNPPTQTFDIQNSGTGVLGWTLTAKTQSGGNWLSVTPTSGTAPSTITVMANATGLAAGSYAGTITITPIAGSNVSNGAQTLNVGLAIDAPMVAAGGIVDAATFAADGLSAGSIASVFGANLAATTATASLTPSPNSAQTTAADSTPLALPTALGRTQVMVNNVAAPLFYVSPNQINFQIPAGVSGNNVPVMVVSNGVQSLAATVNIKPDAPRIFTVGGKQGAVLNEDSTPNSDTNAAAAGSVIQIFADGLGATNPPAITGQIATSSPLSTTATLPGVTIGGLPAEVLFSGLAPGTAGLYQVNARIPAGVAANAAVPLQIQLGTDVSNTVTIAVH